MSNTELIMIAALAVNFLGTLIAIFRAQLKTENRLTHVETMVGMMVRQCSPPDFKYRTTDPHPPGHIPVA